MQTALEVKEKTDVSVELTGPESLIARAIDNNLSVDALERLLTMRNELKREAAKSSFFQALSGFQSDCPVIHKKKEVMNKDGRSVRYVYAPLDDIVAQVKPILARYGLSYKIESEVSEKYLLVKTIVHHVDGHSEESEFRVPIEPSQYMSSIQSHGSASTYAKRYSFCNALGILTGDGDDDGNVDFKKPERDEQLEKVLITINDCNNREELVEVWGSLSPIMRKKAEKAFKERSTEITGGKK